MSISLSMKHCFCFESTITFFLKPFKHYISTTKKSKLMMNIYFYIYPPICLFFLTALTTYGSSMDSEPSNPHHSGDSSCCSDYTRSLMYCATKELLHILLLKFSLPVINKSAKNKLKVSPESCKILNTILLNTISMSNFFKNLMLMILLRLSKKSLYKYFFKENVQYLSKTTFNSFVFLTTLECALRFFSKSLR